MAFTGAALMPKFTFENKWTMGNIIQIAIIVIGGVWAYAQLSRDVSAQSESLVHVRVQVSDLDSTVDDIMRRLPVVERNQVTGKEAREEGQARTDATLAEIQKQNVVILQALSAITARLDERDRSE